LLDWWKSTDCASLVRPWLKARDLWHLLLGTVLFDRAHERIVRDFWPTFAQRWPTPRAFLSDRRRDAAVRVLDRLDAGKKLEELARSLTDKKSPADAVGKIEGISPERIRLCNTLAGKNLSCDPTTPAVRVAARILGQQIPTSRTDGQLVLVQIVGASQSSLAYAALLEIAEQFCKPTDPACTACPIRKWCRTGLAG